MQKYLQSFFILISLSLSLVGNAQLNRGNASFAMLADAASGITDSIFIFNSSLADKYVIAVSPNGSETTFEWFSFNETTQTFQSILTETGASSQFNFTENTGLQLVISGGGNDLTERCWALINDFSVDIYNADIEVVEGETIKKIPEAQKWCHLVRGIRAQIDSSKLIYYDWTDGSAFTMEWSFATGRFNWSASPQPEANEVLNVFQQNDQDYLNIDVEDPYWEDTWYKLTITDNYGYERSDSVLYESIEPHADFSFAYIPLNNKWHYPDRSERYYDIYKSNRERVSAPAKYGFANLSINADTTDWQFGDLKRFVSADDSIFHIYELPGTYAPVLVVYKYKEDWYDACTDTFPKDFEIPELDDYPFEVEESITSDITLPTVFSCPDGEHNYFRFIGDVSITSFEIAIYNRFGNKVYHYKGDMRDWMGWDGTINERENRYVSTGVYYYVVRDLGRLPSYDANRIPRLQGLNTKVDGQDGQGNKRPVNNILRGYVHVYNTN